MPLITFLSSFLPSVLLHFLAQVLRYPAKAKHMMIKPVLTLKLPGSWGCVSRWCHNREGVITTVIGIEMGSGSEWAQQWPITQPRGHWQASQRRAPGAASELVKQSGLTVNTGEFRGCCIKKHNTDCSSFSCFLQVYWLVKWILIITTHPGRPSPPPRESNAVGLC